jgi:hypothetical protein
MSELKKIHFNWLLSAMMRKIFKRSGKRTLRWSCMKNGLFPGFIRWISESFWERTGVGWSSWSVWRDHWRFNIRQLLVVIPAKVHKTTEIFHFTIESALGRSFRRFSPSGNISCQETHFAPLSVCPHEYPKRILPFPWRYLYSLF